MSVGDTVSGRRATTIPGCVPGGNRNAFEKSRSPDTTTDEVSRARSAIASSGAPLSPTSLTSATSWPAATSALVTARGSDSIDEEPRHRSARAKPLLRSKPRGVALDRSDLLAGEVVLGEDLGLGAAGSKEPEHCRRRYARPSDHGLAKRPRRICGDARDDLGHGASVPNLVGAGDQIGRARFTPGRPVAAHDKPCRCHEFPQRARAVSISWNRLPPREHFGAG